MTDLINDTHENCPICFEKYDRENGRLKDGICNSFFESDCNHWCCCMCWDTIYRQRLKKYSCPMCRRDITDWIISQYKEEEEEEDPTEEFGRVVSDDYDDDEDIAFNCACCDVPIVRNSREHDECTARDIYREVEGEEIIDGTIWFCGECESNPRRIAHIQLNEGLWLGERNRGTD